QNGLDLFMARRAGVDGARRRRGARARCIYAAVHYCAATKGERRCLKRVLSPTSI
ncbi:hypothetical protein A2U01_0069610, partial [Trifolium medium]|nr:hypothetical protein [Trifolium medium]